MSLLGVIMAVICAACFTGYGKIVLDPKYDHSMGLGLLAMVFFLTALITGAVAGMEIDGQAWARLTGQT